MECIACLFLPSSLLSYLTTHTTTDKITANGVELKTTPKKANEYVWYKMNKPKGTLTAIEDRSGRKSLSGWVPEIKEKGVWVCVGGGGCVCVCWYGLEGMIYENGQKIKTYIYSLSLTHTHPPTHTHTHTSPKKTKQVSSP